MEVVFGLVVRVAGEEDEADLRVQAVVAAVVADAVIGHDPQGRAFLPSGGTDQYNY